MGLQAVGELGLEQTGLYALYQLSLKSGYLRWRTHALPIQKNWNTDPSAIPAPPKREVLWRVLQSGGNAALRKCIEEASELIQGIYHPYSGPPARLNLQPGNVSRHWTSIQDKDPALDIKDIWEPARFSWAFLLARAYHLTGDERCASVFWDRAQEFISVNPPCMGPNWISGQEVALRILVFAFARTVFATSENTTPEKIAWLDGVIATHAWRIPPTLVYARAQNNNHLLSEAAGLYTAGCLLQEEKWRKLGWHWFNRGVQKQFALDGTYVQHSMNYHRVALHLALWMDAMALRQGMVWSSENQSRLASATRWLMAQLDSETGHTPNLGHNDGALILPFGTNEFEDFRPTAQAASRAFLGTPCFLPGKWDELSLWLGLPLEKNAHPVEGIHDSPAVLRLGSKETWGTLRSVRFSSRPAHADQLHVDLWWRGANIARDAGTYRYTAPPPWQNSLAETYVHNTVMVDEQNQMLHAGRFLWLRWAQAKILHTEESKVVGEHYGYMDLGVIHRRSLASIDAFHWDIHDSLLPSRRHNHTQAHSFSIHWLLPDWSFSVNDDGIRLSGPPGSFTLTVSASTAKQTQIPGRLLIVRAGEILQGAGQPHPTFGWNSTRYAQKTPALSIQVTYHSTIPLEIFSRFTLST